MVWISVIINGETHGSSLSERGIAQIAGLNALRRNEDPVRVRVVCHSLLHILKSEAVARLTQAWRSANSNLKVLKLRKR